MAWILSTVRDGDLFSHREALLVPRKGTSSSTVIGSIWVMYPDTGFQEKSLMHCFIAGSFNSTVNRGIYHFLVIGRSPNFLNPIKYSVIYLSFLSEFCPGVFVGNYIYLCNVTHYLVKETKQNKSQQKCLLHEIHIKLE